LSTFTFSFSKFGILTYFLLPTWVTFSTFFSFEGGVWISYYRLFTTYDIISQNTGWHMSVVRFALAVGWTRLLLWHLERGSNGLVCVKNVWLLLFHTLWDVDIWYRIQILFIISGTDIILNRIQLRFFRCIGAVTRRQLKVTWKFLYFQPLLPSYIIQIVLKYRIDSSYLSLNRIWKFIRRFGIYRWHLSNYIRWVDILEFFYMWN
jgi:hypothetical protein